MAALTIVNLLLTWAGIRLLRREEAFKREMDVSVPLFTDEQKWRATMAGIVTEGRIFADMARRFDIELPVGCLANHAGVLWNVDWDCTAINREGFVLRVRSMPDGRGLVDFVKVR